MNFSPVRIIALIMLIIALLSMSGLTATASALVHADAAPVCCDKEKGDSEKNNLPCPVPDCQCASCMAAELLMMPPVRRTSLESAIRYPSQHRQDLSAYFSSIDYPPESR